MTLPVVELVNTVASGFTPKDFIAELYHQSGIPFVLVIFNTLVLAFALALALWRLWMMTFVYNLSEENFYDQVKKLVISGNIERAIKLCGSVPKSPLASVLRAGLNRANKGEMEITMALEESALEQSPKWSKYVQSLFSIANIATLVGLVSTVLDLIAVFKGLGNLPAEQKAAVLSAGISGAMVNTAFGLGIAVICIFFHLVLGQISKIRIEHLEMYQTKLQILLKQRAAGEFGPGGVVEEARA
ncbi:MAG: MotA/TolQ/ExbB proton channel family protein [Deltaproteobacteria bacterium]|nr:MotA/TolQ/ExbB proton channel family protein [Deltaproteobacteria bacterium]